MAGGGRAVCSVEGFKAAKVNPRVPLHNLLSQPEMPFRPGPWAAERRTGGHPWPLCGSHSGGALLPRHPLNSSFFICSLVSIS